ncbi:hypothetical protein GOBAR_AA37314 [Gossypium barbadense]|uniref:Uncharacterized protein n=1 Tax=Gossypium barbadense TaxID=3634 RepID=A0A2P5VX71_GOSBA|nr:hypothetical protein GOBAR_AA37314 [Gossypium barbadense]
MRIDEFLSQLRGEEDEHEEFIDEVSAISQATQETREYHGERTSKSIPSEFEFTLRGAIPELAGSKSSKNKLSMLYNLIQVSTEVGPDGELPTPYEVSDVYLE